MLRCSGSSQNPGSSVLDSEQFKNLLTIFIVMLHRTKHICMTVDMYVFFINKIKVGLYFKIRENK